MRLFKRTKRFDWEAMWKRLALYWQEVCVNELWHEKHKEWDGVHAWIQEKVERAPK